MSLIDALKALLLGGIEGQAPPRRVRPVAAIGACGAGSTVDRARFAGPTVFGVDAPTNGCLSCSGPANNPSVFLAGGFT